MVAVFLETSPLISWRPFPAVKPSNDRCETNVRSMNLFPRTRYLSSSDLFSVPSGVGLGKNCVGYAWRFLISITPSYALKVKISSAMP